MVRSANNEGVKPSWIDRAKEEVLSLGTPTLKLRSARDSFDTRSSESSSYADSPISPHNSLKCFADSASLCNGRVVPVDGYGIALWPKTPLQTNELGSASRLTSNHNLEPDWWYSAPHTNHHETHAYDVCATHDGLPSYTISETGSSLWSYGANLCTSPCMAVNQDPAQVMAFEAPLAMSTSDSSQGSYQDSSASNSDHSSPDDEYNSLQKSKTIRNHQYPIRERQVLPSEPSRASQHFTTLSCSGRIPHESQNLWEHKKTGIRSTTSDQGISYSTASNGKPNLTQQDSKIDQAKPMKERPFRHSWDSSTKPPVMDEKPQDRTEKDNFLVQSKLAGMSYKEIRRKGNFTEAESTLRGRFRTLTKHKAARVRKPEWNENDVSTDVSFATVWILD